MELSMSTVLETRIGERGPGRPLPLNLKGLTTVHVQQLAKALGLLIAALADEIHQMIGGKLEEMGRDPPNVQVLLQQEASG